MAEQEPTVKISTIDYYAAQQRWVDYWADQMMPIPNFVSFLDTEVQLTDADLMIAVKFMISQSAARKISILNGPHYYALLKAYQINHPAEVTS